MLDQRQSPFFRLPRELRDNIYEYYAHDADGVFYDYASDKLQYASQGKHQDKNALTNSCKLAAEEMQFIAMRVNTITFVPARSEADGIKYNDLDSKAGRFERLLQSARRMKIHILHHVAKGGCVTPAMVDEVAAKFPGIARYYHGISDSDYRWRWQISASFCDALHHTLELAASHPRFNELAAEATVTPYRFRGMMPPFITGSQEAVLAWNPERGRIPVESDVALEPYLTDPLLRDSEGCVDWPEPVVPVCWYFSATAVAVNFLRRLPPTTRICIRLPIVIREERWGIDYCESHVRAIAPYFHENPSLIVELHVGFWTNLDPPFWLQSLDHEATNRSVWGQKLLRPMADFLDELSSISNSSNPIRGLSVHIEGRMKESV
ncbi:hypothetical protein Ptr902_04252 [Pyrenophora tritici-repentis]|nr:hypothetical protein Ptr902_04252 [Pyrenophora tritici-repentis]